MKRYDIQVLGDVTGLPVVGATFSVFLSSNDPVAEGTVLATLYGEDDHTSIPIANPINADDQPYFYVADGIYDLVAQVGSKTKRLNRQELVNVASLSERALMLPPGESAPNLPPASQRRGGGKILAPNPDTGAIEVQPIDDTYRGPPGEADNTYTSLATFRSSAVTRKTASLTGITGVPDGRYYFKTDSPPYVEKLPFVIKADSTPLSVGAWVRQDGSSITFYPHATSCARDLAAKVGETVSVTDFGAVGDGTNDDTAAINAALASGGRIAFPRGTYKITGMLFVTVDRTAIVLDAGVTIIGNPWRFTGTQTPFGSLLLITADNCSVEGAGLGNSLIQLTGGSEVNGVTFLHCGGGRVANLTIDGGKVGSTAIRDDTFQTGVSFINSASRNLAGTYSRGLVDNVEIRNFVQYAAQAYGNLARYITFRRCHLHDIGITAQNMSVGSGIALTSGPSDIVIEDCAIVDNKQDGVFVSSAGVAINNVAINNSTVARNGRWGVNCSEEANLSSISGVGTAGVRISGNIENNGTGGFRSGGGVRIGTYDGVGTMLHLAVSAALIRNNIGFGVLVQTNDSSTNRTSDITIDAIITGNLQGGLGIGAKIDSTVRYDASKISGNTGGDVLNFGDSRLVSGARGIGPAIAVASTITIPPDAGTTFSLIGSGTIDTINGAVDGEIYTFIFGGTITITAGARIIMAASYTAPGNSTIMFQAFGTALIKIGGSVNA